MIKGEQRGKDPHLGLQWWVEIDGVEIAGFSECSGLQIETEVFEYAEGGLNGLTHKFPVRTKYGNITLKRGMDPGRDLYMWFLESMRAQAQGKGQSVRKNLTINLYGRQPNQAPVQSWSLRRAFPIKWTGPDLKADAGAVALETIEFAHEGLIFNNASNRSQNPNSNEAPDLSSWQISEHSSLEAKTPKLK